MRLYYILVIMIFLAGCSFDNKSGIWKNEKNIEVKNDKEIFKDFKKIKSPNEIFNKIIPLQNDLKYKIDSPIINNSWEDIFYGKNNNFPNIQYSNLNENIFKSKKLSRYKTQNNILFSNGNLILSDQKGNLIIFSVKENKIFRKYNFYKKRFKDIKKNLNLVIENNIIYISDNIGFFYAYDYLTDKLVWAKNYKIPFRSNLKISINKLISSNQNNDLIILDKSTGNLIKTIPSESTSINSSFINNISLSTENIFYLNTYGSLYSIHKDNLRLNWFVNLNKSLDLNINNLFEGNKIVNYKNKIFISSNQNFYIIDAKTGVILSKKNFSLKLKPIVINNYIFLITNNDLLIAMNLENNKILYSYDLSKKISDFINLKGNLDVKNFMFINNKLFIFLKEPYIISSSLNGEIEDMIKLSTKVNSSPIFVDKSLLYLDRNNRLLIFN